MEKQKSPDQKTIRKFANPFDLGAVINAVKAKMQSIKTLENKVIKLEDAVGITRGGYHTHTGYGSGRFKQNQRKERLRSRRRKMKPNARN